MCPIDHTNPLLRDHNKTAQIDWICTEFAEWCEDQPAKEIVWIAGNHDFGPEETSFRHRIEEAFPEWVHYIKDEVHVTKDGYNVYGMPWTPNLSTWAFYASWQAWQWLPDDIPAYTDILMIHSPPAGAMLDRGHPDWATPEPMFREIVDRVQPELVVCGHIHEGYGTFEFRDITFANVAHCDEQYVPWQKPMEWEFPIARD